MTPDVEIAGSFEIAVNGEPMAIAAGTSLFALVERLAERLGRPAAAIAVERNGEIVARGRWAETLLAAGDRLEIVQFVQGGAEPLDHEKPGACAQVGARC
jgi:thiamine biosynthesis protein ThiS